MIVPEIGLDLAIAFGAFVALVMFEPPADRAAWARAFSSAIFAGLMAGQIASHFGAERTLRNIAVGVAAYVGDGLLEVGLRLRRGLRDDPVGVIKAVTKLRSGKGDDMKSDDLGSDG